MMSTNNENYVNDVNVSTFTSIDSSGKGAPRDSYAGRHSANPQRRLSLRQSSSFEK